ncbi:alpha/beta hydrolase fold domain-containing protein [Streptomyces anandii]|uniref:alpha/beta hydrolase fold domain-containing protein n=1 Tax=Streptomyces anandii TaxID=285454 RepID=UPI0036FD5E7C
MVITDEDCLAETPAFDKESEAAAASRPTREQTPDATVFGVRARALSVMTLLRLRDRHGTTGAFRAAHLLFGPYHLPVTPSQRSFGSRRLLSNTDTLRRTWQLFTPGMTPEQRRDPEVSPLQADLAGLPPALVVVGTEDPLLDDSAGRESDRVVEPVGLLTAGGRWYLIAWCRTRQARGGFRLDPRHGSGTDHGAGSPPPPGRTAARLGCGRRGATHHAGPAHPPPGRPDITTG